jgi:mevalonate kinase
MRGARKPYYSGYKMPTVEVLARVATETAKRPDVVADLYRLMGKVTHDGIAALLADDLPRLGTCMNIYQGLLDATGNLGTQHTGQCAEPVNHTRQRRIIHIQSIQQTLINIHTGTQTR